MDGDAAWAAVRDHVSRKATVIADEHASYNDLAGLNKLKRVNHSKEYQSEDGTNTNQVESFFSRVQRAHLGIHHRFSLKYFDWYVAELAWREDSRDSIFSRAWPRRSSSFIPASAAFDSASRKAIILVVWTGARRRSRAIAFKPTLNARR